MVAELLTLVDIGDVNLYHRSLEGADAVLQGNARVGVGTGVEHYSDGKPKDQMIISDGFNGTPSGFENVCEENNVTLPYVLHAEANAITKLARSSNNSDGATLYVTDAPCIECSKLIIQAGIKRVVYARAYRLDDGIKLLKQANIEVEHINPENNVQEQDK